MIKLSKLTDYAIVILGEMAAAPGSLMTASDLSQKTTLPEPTVSKVLKLLTKGQVVDSTRGVNGGYSFNGNPEDISIAQVITALDGPVALTACVDGGNGVCEYEENCKVKEQWGPVNDAMKAALENVPLSQMIGGQK